MPQPVALLPGFKFSRLREGYCKGGGAMSLSPLQGEVPSLEGFQSVVEKLRSEFDEIRQSQEGSRKESLGEQGTNVGTFGQRVLFCRCGESRLYAAGKCLPCYSRDKRNERHYAGLREAVLKRDGYRCRTCRFTPSAEQEWRLLVVHHRQPGVSEIPLMLTLCAGCHARVERTKLLTRDVPKLVRQLWR